MGTGALLPALGAELVSRRARRGTKGIGDMLWREGTVCVIVQRDAESARVRVLNMLLCDFTATGNCLGARVQWQRHV